MQTSIKIINIHLVEYFPDDYKFIDLSREEVEEINLLFPSKKFKNNEKYIKNLY